LQVIFPVLLWLYSHLSFFHYLIATVGHLLPQILCRCFCKCRSIKITSWFSGSYITESVNSCLVTAVDRLLWALFHTAISASCNYPPICKLRSFVCFKLKKIPNYSFLR